MKLPFSLAALLALAAPAAAQSPLASFKLQSAETLAAARSELQAARDQMIASLDAFLAGLQADNFGTPLVDTLADDGLEFGARVVKTWTDRGEELAQQGTDALELLATPEPLDGHYPKDFLAGAGGAFDKAVAKLEREVRKAVTAVQKHAAKVEAAAAKVGFGVALDVRVPRERTFSVPQEAGQYADAGNSLRYDVYLVGGASRLGEDGDALIFGAGDTFAALVPEVAFVGVSRDGAGNTIVASVDVAPIEDVVPGFDGWKAILDGGGQGLREGNWVIRVGEPNFSEGVARVGVP